VKDEVGQPKDKDDQPNSTLGGIIVRQCDTKPQIGPYARWECCRKPLSTQKKTGCIPRPGD